MRTAIYDSMLAELEAGERNSIARRVFAMLKQHPEGIDRRTFVLFIYNVQAKEDLASDTHDRKIRNTIARMRARLIPIISTSGESGYRLDDSDKARKELLSEMISRRNHIDEQIKSASMAWKIPVKYTEPEIAIQVRLI
jgi:hypothetical protein